jgi:choline dehydrogenase-like flavoprotein
MSESIERADVLVIGAGPSGAVVSRRLAIAGFDVVCLEQGRWISAAERVSDTLEWELLGATTWNPNPNVRAWREDYPCAVSESDIQPSMFNAVGGGTIHFGAEWPRFLPSDFRVYSHSGVGDDWPLTYDDLLPYYERVDRDIGVSGTGGNPAYPPGRPPPMPALPIGAHGRRAAEGMNALGWHWWPGNNTIASKPYGRLGQCVGRGTCGAGCPEGAKGSVDITLWPDAIGAGAKLLTGARVQRITVGPHGRVSGADWIDRDGRRHHQAADVVVMAANGIGTPRLLLLSSSDRYPEGLANSSGLVGKRLMMHPFLSVLGIYEDDLQSWSGPFGTPVYSMEFAETDWSRGFPRGAKLIVMPVPGPTHLLTRLAGLPASERTGNAMHRLVERALGRCFEWTVAVEDLPDEANSVTLDPELTDGDGTPAPRLRYRISDWSQKALEWHSQRAVEAHEAAGAIEIYPFNHDPAGAGHMMGTARMGDDPQSSVVDRYGRSHDAPNLFVVDASVFVTGSSANPTPTLAALALRTADHIVKTARDQVVPP